jgi:hypothetical protein
MQKIFTTLLLALGLTTYGQSGMWKPFKLYLIKPDTAIIGKSLLSDRESIEADNLKSYYSSLKQMEDLLNFKDYSKEMEKSFKETQERLKKQITLMKMQEDNVKKFKYFFFAAVFARKGVLLLRFWKRDTAVSFNDKSPVSCRLDYSG